jgi:ankyrin repeat protein
LPGDGKRSQSLDAGRADLGALRNHTLIAGLLIGAGADVNAADAAGWRPLHLAAAHNNLDAMKALIAQGAEISATSVEGLTPLAIARQRNHLEAAALLQRHGS